MKKINFLWWGIAATIILVFLLNPISTSAATEALVQTNTATEVENGYAVLNGYLYSLGGDTFTNVWFQYGETSSYGQTTTSQNITTTSSFGHPIYNLTAGTTYHYRAVASNSYGTVYGADMTFISGQVSNQYLAASAGPDLYVTTGNTVTLQGSGSSYNGSTLNYIWSCNGGTLSNSNIAQPVFTAPSLSSQASFVCTLTAANTQGYSASDSTTVYVNNANSNVGGKIVLNKSIKNLTAGTNDNYSCIAARPSDVLLFTITIQSPSNQQLDNVYIRDMFPQNLIYKNNLTVSGAQNYYNNSADITNGINIGSVSQGQMVTITYQAQVADENNFSYGASSIIPKTTVTSSQGSADFYSLISISRTAVYGITDVVVGTTNDILMDSFFIQLALVLLFGYLYFSGKVYQFADWIATKI